MAPELAVPGKTTAVLVTLHGPTSLQPLNVTLRLLSAAQRGADQQLVETTQEIRGKYSILNFVSPDLISTSLTYLDVENQLSAHLKTKLNVERSPVTDAKIQFD